MKRTIIFSFIMATLCMSGFVVNAEMPDTAPPQKDKGSIASGENEILTAIDVVDLMQHGSSDADIAKVLSDRRGYDRESALKKGNTDEQIIQSLISDPAKKAIDDKKSMQHRTEGDIYFRKSQYDKAAKEYTLAVKYSDNKYEPYMLRADTYKQYLKTQLNPVPESFSDKAKQHLFDKSKRLLCNSIHADYSEAMRVNDKTVSDIVLEINALKGKMISRTFVSEKDSKVAASRYRAGQNVHNMRKLNKLNASYLAAQKANKAVHNTINAAISDYKLVCEVKVDAAHQELKKVETDKKRDGK